MLLKANEELRNPSIEMTPIIDMVFLLLVFFLVATTFQQAEREMQIALPFTSSAGPISATLREIVINVDVKGNIIVTGRPLSAEDLKAMIEEAVAVNPQQKVTVRGDRGTPYGNVVRVLDICKRSGIQEPYLDTILEE
jgi:biopolymer transport protein ExbD